MLDPIEAAKRLSDDLMMGYVSRPNGGGMTWNENREAADALIALVLAEARADGDATIATLRAAHDKTAEALVIAVQQALAAESQVTRLRAALAEARLWLMEDVDPDAVITAIDAALATAREVK